jgi:hypothetical protein
MEHFWLAAPSAGFADFSTTGDFNESENRRILRVSGFAIGGIGRASPRFKITHRAPAGPAAYLVARDQSGEYGQRGALPTEETNSHDDSGGNGGGVFRGSFGM